MNLARAIAQAVKNLGDDVILHGLASSCFVKASNEIGISLWQEVFADRRYTSEGYLVPRTQVWGINRGWRRGCSSGATNGSKGWSDCALDGSGVKVQADTLCIHGDNPTALDFARKIKALL